MLLKSMDELKLADFGLAREVRINQKITQYFPFFFFSIRDILDRGHQSIELQNR